MIKKYINNIDTSVYILYTISCIAITVDFFVYIPDFIVFTLPFALIVNSFLPAYILIGGYYFLLLVIPIIYICLGLAINNIKKKKNGIIIHILCIGIYLFDVLFTLYYVIFKWGMDERTIQILLAFITNIIIIISIVVMVLKRRKQIKNV